MRDRFSADFERARRLVSEAGRQTSGWILGSRVCAVGDKAKLGHSRRSRPPLIGSPPEGKIARREGQKRYFLNSRGVTADAAVSVDMCIRKVIVAVK